MPAGEGPHKTVFYYYYYTYVYSKTHFYNVLLLRHESSDNSALALFFGLL